jgi:hypothetical protein
MASLPVDLQSGLDLQSKIWRQFHLLVSPSMDLWQKEFLLVDSFGRCMFRLDPLSVGFLLRAVIGGLAQDFNVIALSDQVFQFSVSSKQVGIFIYQLQFFKCSDFIVYVHL